VAAILVWGLLPALAPAGSQSLIDDASPFLLVVLILLPITMAIILIIVLTPARDRTIGLKTLLLLLVLGSLVPARALLADGVVVLAAVSLGTAVVGFVLIVLTARQPEPNYYLLVAAGVATWLGWLIAFTHDYTSPLESSTWVFLLAVAFPVFSIIVTFGIADAAEARAGLVGHHFSHKFGIIVVGVVIIIKCAFLAWRFTSDRGILGDKETLWAVRTWTSWPHAFLVAALFVGLVLRSQARPTIQRGRSIAIAMLTVGAASVLVAAIADQFASMIQLLGPLVNALLGDGMSVPLATNEHFFDISHWLALAAVIALVLVFTVWPGLRDLTGHHQALVAGLYLIPPVGAIAMLEDNPALDLPTIWATPGQVDTCLTLIVVGLTLASAISKRPLIDDWTLVRILVGPIVVIYTCLSLPEVLEVPLVVIGALGAMFLLLPPPASDRS
jgi:hypothetical protein